MTNFRILPYSPVHSRYFPLPPPPPQKDNNIEVWPEHFCSRLNNIDQEGVGEGVTMVPNSQGGCPVSKKVQNS